MTILLLILFVQSTSQQTSSLPGIDKLVHWRLIDCYATYFSPYSLISIGIRLIVQLHVHNHLLIPRCSRVVACRNGQIACHNFFIYLHSTLSEPVTSSGTEMTTTSIFLESTSSEPPSLGLR